MNDHYMKILERCGDSKLTGMPFRQFCMAAIAEIDGYDWCGIYKMDGPDYLELDAYVGAPNDNIRIPVGSGVCGSAVAEQKNQVVADVNQLENYLSCSIKTKSEIVVLIWTDTESRTLLGQIDLDSHIVNRFSQEDEQFLDELGVLIADRW